MEILLYTVIGFCAQMIDGMLGMAYGVSCRTFLSMFTGVPTAAVSAVVHYAEVPTSFVSMISHIKLKNIDKDLFLKLVIPGVIGSVIGAYIITNSFDWIELVVDVYLVIMGARVLAQAFKHRERKFRHKYAIYVLGFAGAFFDAAGGGGYGPIVTGSLMASRNEPKKAIGTVNSSEFFVTLASSITFFILVSDIGRYIPVIAGLIIGGVIAAPIAAKLCMKANEKLLYAGTGALLMFLNICNIINYFQV